MGRSEIVLLAGGLIWSTFTLVGGIEWFLSSRPKLFVRFFVRRSERRAVYRTLLRDPDRQRKHRRTATVQFALGILAAIGAILFAWFG